MMMRRTFIRGPSPEAHPAPPSRVVPAAPATFRKSRLVKVLFIPPLSLRLPRGDYSYRPVPGPRREPALVRECPRWERGPGGGYDDSARERAGPLPARVTSGQRAGAGGAAGLLRVLQASQRRQHRGARDLARALPGPLPRPRAGPGVARGVRGLRAGVFLRDVRDAGPRPPGEARPTRIAAPETPLRRLGRARRRGAVPYRRHSGDGHLLISRTRQARAGGQACSRASCAVSSSALR